MIQNGPRMTQNDPKWPKNYPKWPKITPNGPKMTPGFTHFFRNFFLTEKAVSQTFSLLECMGGGGGGEGGSGVEEEVKRARLFASSGVQAKRGKVDMDGLAK